jgi:hypothetical protein
LAAVPGSSAHEQGYAADVQATDPSQQAALRALAPQFGLATIGPSDPNHFQLANWKTAANAPATNTGAANTLLTAKAGPPPLGTTINATSGATPALAGDHAAFIRAYAQSKGLDPNLALGIANAEGLKAWSAKNPNAGSTIDVDPSGTPFSYGDFQLNIHPGAMGSKALAAGIDPRDPAQWQAADRFAIDQMAKSGVGPWKGDPVAAAYLKSGAVPATPAGSGPIDPSILARGGYSPPIPGDAAPATPGTTLNTAGALPGFPDKATSDSFTSGVKQMTGQSQPTDGDNAPPKAPPLPAAPGARNVSPLVGNPQLYQQIMAGLSQPMQIAQGPPGQNPWTGVGIQPPQQSPGAPFGLSLNSALYDPSMSYMGMNSYG